MTYEIKFNETETLIVTDVKSVIFDDDQVIFYSEKSEVLCAVNKSSYQAIYQVMKEVQS